MKALPIDVYRTAGLGDCTNGGVSAKYSRLLLVCDKGFMDVDEENPPENLVVLRKRFLFGNYVYDIRPYAKPSGTPWTFGGNYAATSDSRFSEMIGGMYGAVAIHDRTETWEQYDALD